MAKLSELLKFKKEVTLINEADGEKLAKVWVRLLGDEDLKEAFKYARIASAKKRTILADKNSADYQDNVAQLAGQPTEDLIDIIVAARENVFSSEAGVVVDREDLPEIESVAKRPDAPTLEEQEKLDALVAEQEKDYDQRVKEYIESRILQTKSELSELPLADLAAEAANELVNIDALQEFLAELNDQKIFRGTFEDKACTARGFETLEECANANISIKKQLLDAYDSLEVNGEDIKN